ncbi:unnamed protein product [Rotaria sp. Silwood2]|nr:unnamed protein product [Rotaria sp. Silwood2]CAF2904472.1 unnamed protein product [Rotaria sp. Silwood2]CAF4073397.1 unnamed protein product [Rotaria sp. Silwood2]CAF4286272.1 unnamed protein product [Rotaria sp. Silwood2]
MVTAYADSADKTISTAIIVIIVIVSLISIVFLIGCTIGIVCLIKHCNRPSNIMRRDQVLPPYPSNVPNYSPEYPPAYSTLNQFHSSSGPEFTKLPVP